MNANAELLNFVYQNSQMGVETLKQIEPMIENEKFSAQIMSQLKEYKQLHQSAKDMLNKNGYDEKGINSLEKLTVYFMINMKTITDKSSAHIAEMMVKGSNMGIINAIKNIKIYENDAEKDSVELMKRLLGFEENNIELLKEFL